MTELNDELLVAYVDGQLAKDQSQAIERVLEEDQVAAQRVEALRATLAKVTDRKLDQNRLLATFDIREFGARGRRRKGCAINVLPDRSYRS